MKTFVTKIDGTKKEVKNLGWLLRHADEVDFITLSDRDDGARCGCKFVADLGDGTKYETAFNSTEIARRWIKRPSLSQAVITDHATIA